LIQGLVIVGAVALYRQKRRQTKARKRYFRRFSAVAKISQASNRAP